MANLQQFPRCEGGGRKLIIVSDHLSQPETRAGRSLLLPTLTFCAAAAPVAFLIVLLLHYSVSIPTMDDWDLMPLITKAHEGNLRFSDLLAQQQESRTFFPKLIFILLGLGRRWDGRVAIMFSVLICCLTSLGLYELLRRSAISGMARSLAFIMMVLFIFSPVQHDLWLLASGFSSFMPALFIVCGLCVLRTDLPVATKFWSCVCLAVLSSFTLANGLLAWALTFPFLFCLQPIPNWKRWLGAWLVACAICCAIYFWRFEPPRELPAFAPPKSPLVYFQYLLVFLGAGLARSGNEYPLAVSMAVGAFLLLGYFCALGWVVRRWRDREFRARALPWFALGAYAIASGVLAALGRVEFGVSQALESRYAAFSLYLAIAIIAFATMFAVERFAARPNSSARLALFTATFFLAASYITLEVLCAAASISTLHLRSATMRLGQGAVLFGRVMDTSDTIRRANHPVPNLVRQRAAALDRLHLLRPPLVRTTMISKLRHANADDIAVAGWFDGFVTSPEPSMVAAKGWAALVEQGRSADCVILAYEREDHEWIAFAISSSIEMRPDVSELRHRPDWVWTGWRAVFPADAIPKGSNITAWAVDAKQAKVYRLGAGVDRLDP